MTQGKYSAPALGKGLDILEFLAGSEGRITLTDLATALNKSVSEIFRCVYVLEQRGYVSIGNGGIVATRKVFDLSLDTPIARDLLEIAYPEMINLNRLTLQSSYLTVASGNHVVVIASQAAPSPFGVDTRLGARLPFDSAAGYVHFTAGTKAEKTKWTAHLLSEVSTFDLGTFQRGVDQSTQLGWAERQSHMFGQIVDLACLIVPVPSPAFALCIPMVQSADLTDHRTCKRSLLEAASQIGRKLRHVLTDGPEAPHPIDAPTSRLRQYQATGL